MANVILSRVCEMLTMTRHTDAMLPTTSHEGQVDFFAQLASSPVPRKASQARESRTRESQGFDPVENSQEQDPQDEALPHDALSNDFGHLQGVGCPTSGMLGLDSQGVADNEQTAFFKVMAPYSDCPSHDFPQNLESGIAAEASVLSGITLEPLSMAPMAGDDVVANAPHLLKPENVFYASVSPQLGMNPLVASGVGSESELFGPLIQDLAVAERADVKSIADAALAGEHKGHDDNHALMHGQEAKLNPVPIDQMFQVAQNSKAFFDDDQLTSDLTDVQSIPHETTGDGLSGTMAIIGARDVKVMSIPTQSSPRSTLKIFPSACILSSVLKLWGASKLNLIFFLKAGSPSSCKLNKPQP
jgi:hypothetical protein